MPAGSVKEAKDLIEDAAVAGAAKLAVTVAVKLYERITGFSYSDTEIENLKKLKQLYILHLKTKKSPVAWELDDKNRPTRRMNPDDCQSVMQEASVNRGSVGHFYYPSNLIAGAVASYLSKRGSRSSGGNGWILR